jgi:hypothetical protein
MKRFLSECKTVQIVPFIDLKGKSYIRKFKLGEGQTALNNELLLGTYDEKTYLFINKENEGLFALTHDDFTFDFLDQELKDLELALDNISIPIDLPINNIIPLDNGGD